MPKVLTSVASSVRRDGPPPPPWPSFTGVSQFVGTSSSGRVTVYVDPSLGGDGLQNAQDLVADADRVVSLNDAIFGITGGPVSVIVFALDGRTDGTGGADHDGCDFQTGAAIEACAAFGNSARVSALFEAELSECCMNGNLCGVSTGEALSRWCAATTSNNALADFATAPTWAQAGMPDFVNTTDPTDRNPISTGCGMAFISWLLSQGSSLAHIAQAMVSLGDTGTLAQLYSELTNRPASDAFPSFLAAVQALPHGVTSDDPFGGNGNAPAAAIHPDTAKLAGEVFAEILTAVAAGASAEAIVARVKPILRRSGGVGRHAGLAAACSIKSHRLRPPGGN